MPGERARAQRNSTSSDLQRLEDRRCIVCRLDDSLAYATRSAPGAYSKLTDDSTEEENTSTHRLGHLLPPCPTHSIPLICWKNIIRHAIAVLRNIGHVVKRDLICAN